MTVISMCLTTLMFGAAKVPVVPISVVVIAPRDVTDSLVSKTCTEAQRIWAPAGVSLECSREASKAEPRGLTMDVTIDDRHAPVDQDDALGWIGFTSDGPDRLMHLSRTAAERLLRSTPGLNAATIAAHEAFLGRALGRVLAHELGHYLLRSKVHTSHGLMRAVWTSDEIFDFSHRGFELTAREQTTASDYLRELLLATREGVGAPPKTKSSRPVKFATVTSGRKPSSSAG